MKKVVSSVCQKKSLNRLEKKALEAGTLRTGEQLSENVTLLEQSG